MIRRIVNIDEEKCTGCGACADACHEGAIGMVNGKAKLLRDDYCDGLGDCLPACPADAISFIEREAAEYDEKAVQAHMEERKAQKAAAPEQHACPGTQARSLKSFVKKAVEKVSQTQTESASQLMQWPCQIKLMPIKAPYYQGAKLLIAADCSAFAYANMHSEFMQGRITVNGCPKLDNIDYSEKLTEILCQNDIKSVLIVRMEVPCCGGLVMAAQKALQNCGKLIPWQVVTLSIDGKILDRA